MSVFKPFLLICVIGCCICYSCTDSSHLTDNDFNHYIHVSHTQLFDTFTQVVDPRIEQIKYDQFDLVLLGGDLCEASSKRYDILQYLDGIFDIDAPTTLWSLGNHDNTRLDYIEKATTRPHFYTYHKNKITFVVLYTQEEEDWKCTITGKQMDLLRSVTDTISASSHLVVMTHKLIWLFNHPELTKHRGRGKRDWSCNYKVYRNGWKDEILPLLQKVMKRDIQVIALAGDIGDNVNTFEERTSDGIYYLASGNHPNNKNAKFLHFKHHLPTGRLNWKFEHLEDFLKSGQPLD